MHSSVLKVAGGLPVSGRTSGAFLAITVVVFVCFGMTLLLAKSAEI